MSHCDLFLLGNSAHTIKFTSSPYLPQLRARTAILGLPAVFPSAGHLHISGHILTVSTPGFRLRWVWRNVSFLAEVIAVWYWLCIRGKISRAVGAVRHEDACTAGPGSRIYSPVSGACKFRPGSEGMIMSCFLKDGRGLCARAVSWTGMIRKGGRHEPCHYVSPGFPMVLI